MAYKRLEKDGYTLYQNESGPAIGTAGVPVFERDSCVFRDLSRSGKLLPYENWRLTPEERAKDLTARLTVNEMIGLMLHSSSQPVPALPRLMEVVGTYGGKPFAESGAEPWALTDQQKTMLRDYGMRHFLVSKFQSEVGQGAVLCLA